MDDENQELRNPFPSPPSHYKNYTPHNLSLLALLKERTKDAKGPVDQKAVLSGETDVPDWPLTQLEKPRVDWIVEEDYYQVFGERWPITDVIAPLSASGLPQLYPSDPNEDRRPALISILRSMLATYSKLTAALLAPPPTRSTAEEAPEWVAHAEWIRSLAFNIIAAVNELRPVQARGNLEGMMRRQLELRREETRTMHRKCDEIESKLAEFRASAKALSSRSTNVEDVSGKAELDTSQVEGGPSAAQATTDVTSEDVFRWAESVTIN